MPVKTFVVALLLGVTRFFRFSRIPLQNRCDAEGRLRITEVSGKGGGGAWSGLSTAWSRLSSDDAPGELKSLWLKVEPDTGSWFRFHSSTTTCFEVERVGELVYTSGVKEIEVNFRTNTLGFWASKLIIKSRDCDIALYKVFLLLMENTSSLPIQDVREVVKTWNCHRFLLENGN